MATLVLIALSFTALSATVLILEAGFRLLRLVVAVGERRIAGAPPAGLAGRRPASPTSDFVG